MRNKFVLGIVAVTLVLIGLLTWLSLTAKDGAKNTLQSTAKAHTVVEEVEDIDKSMPYGFVRSDGKTTWWVYPHWTIDGKIFKIDTLSDNYKPVDDRFKLIQLPSRESQKMTEPVKEPVVEEPVSELIVEVDEPVSELIVEPENTNTYGVLLGIDFTLYHYCHCAICNGVAGRATASGRMPEVGVTVAVDPSIIRLGSRLRVEIPDGNGGYTSYLAYARADDTGSGISGHKLDVFVSGHQEAKNKGIIRNARVYLLEG